MFFAYDRDDGMHFFATAEEAKKHAESQLESHAEYASGDGWLEEVTDVCWGEITERATRTNYRERPVEFDEDGCDSETGDYWNPEWSYMCSYELRRVTGG